MKSFKVYIKSRLVAIIVVTAIALIYGLFTCIWGGSGPLHRQLSEATGLKVHADSIKWIDQMDIRGLKSATGFSDVAFLASAKGEKNADLFLAQIKLTPNEKLLEVSTPINLTRSDAGDDFQFEVRHKHIGVMTRVLGQVRSLTVFDLNGAPRPTDGSWSALQRLLGRITDFQKTGRFNGIGKTTIRFVSPGKSAQFKLSGQPDSLALNLQWIDSKKTAHSAKVKLNEMTAGTGSEDVQILKEVRLPKRPILWMVDSVRELSWIGPGPIEWAEGRFFAMKDQLNQWKYSISGDEGQDTPEAFVAASRTVKIDLPQGTEVGDYNQLDWPPKELEAPVFGRKKSGEGEWIPANPEFMKTLPNAPSSVYKTYIRSDIRRPYTHVKLYAIDTRQLELNMVGGHEDPISTTGEVGTGQLPRDKHTVERVALVFNGAFKTIHGEYGMMADRTVLLPPKDDAATVATDDQGRIALGSWPKETPIPDAMVSFRQNMDPLLENGVVNPRKRYLWGFTLGSDITQMNTVRSGLCMRDDGIMVYAWGDDLTAETLGIAMRAAECSYGIHLDMNPFHTSLVAFQMEYRGEDMLPRFKYEKLIRDIRFWPDRYVHGAPKDFFYMTLRDTSPPPIGGKNGWSAEHITQPAPAFLPSVFRQEDSGVSMLAIDTRAVQPHLLSGAIPTDIVGEVDTVNDSAPDDTHMVAEAMLGKWSSNRGQMTQGTVVASLRRDKATLYADDDTGALHIAPWSPEQIRTRSAIQGNWFIRNGEVSEEVSEASNGHTSGIVLAIKNNWIFIARGNGYAIAEKLKAMGILQAISFNDDMSRILVRSNGKMTDIKGNPQNSRDLSLTALRFNARARMSFGTRLKDFFTPGETR
ncbi:MAG: hypothetical protein JXR76_23660 [Deltaproteobacteria bacterium]|nr:hypothetical protein [Deltaproteobacteria bacterium]